MLLIQFQRAGHTRPRACTVEYAGVSVQFRPARLASTGGYVIAGRIPDGPDGETARRHASGMPGVTIGEDDAVEWIGDGGAAPPTARETSAAEPLIVSVRTTASRNGWTAEDFDGTGRGDNPGANGGRSALSGLTLAEMAISRPPLDWDAKRATHYPWELAWTPPGVGWTAPALKSKRPEKAPEKPKKPPKQTAGADKPPETKPAAADAKNETPPGTGDAGQDGDAGGQGAGLIGDLADPNGTGAGQDGAGAAPSIGDYPAEHVERARTLLRELAAVTGKPPSASRANYILRGAQLPDVTSKGQIAALIA